MPGLELSKIRKIEADMAAEIIENGTIEKSVRHGSLNVTFMSSKDGSCILVEGSGGEYLQIL